MGKKIALLAMLFIFLFGTMAYAHSGRTDSSGGHNCSESSKAKGLCTGYHYHNGGGATSGGTSSGGGSSTIINHDKDCTDFATYDEMIAYWNSKGYSATYDPENLDGWGNGQVDDGIPCEAPSGYDLTKINNSPQQNQYKQDQVDRTNGEAQGYEQGLTDGYIEAANNSVSGNTSAAYNQGYATGYNRGYDEGKKKIESEKTQANSEGYTLGQNQETIETPAKYALRAGLKKAFEDGFNRALSERVEAKKKELETQGYNDGKEDVSSPPKDVEEIYIQSYQKGYEKGQKELRDQYINQGYEAAFKMIDYKKPNLDNEKFTEWYEEGFKSNKEVLKIKTAAQSLGKEGSPLKVPADYTKGEIIFKHYYGLGLKEYEDKKTTQQQTTAGGLGIAGLLWLGRRFYIAKKMIK